MTITWTMVLDFSASFAITTGPSNYSYAALENQGMGHRHSSGRHVGHRRRRQHLLRREVDKFSKFGLTRIKAKHVHPPLIPQYLTNIECRMTDIIERHSIVILQGVAAYLDADRKERRLIHAIGDGTFTVDGRKFDRKEMMREKLPNGV
jgi:flavin reductase (DIM6/NTAB) family NADH-FMN oxidoreductase RutF